MTRGYANRDRSNSNVAVERIPAELNPRGAAVGLDGGAFARFVLQTATLYGNGSYDYLGLSSHTKLRKEFV